MLSAPELATIKAAERRLVLKAGGQEACAAVPGMRLKRHQSFNDFGNGDLVDRHMPIDVLATLERFAGAPEVTRVLADLAGCMLVPMPRGQGSAELSAQMGRSAKEFGEVLIGIGQSLADGKISAQEAAESEREIDEAILELVALKYRLRLESARSEGEP